MAETKVVMLPKLTEVVAFRLICRGCGGAIEVPPEKLTELKKVLLCPSCQGRFPGEFENQDRASPFQLLGQIMDFLRENRQEIELVLPGLQN